MGKKSDKSFFLKPSHTEANDAQSLADVSNPLQKIFEIRARRQFVPYDLPALPLERLADGSTVIARHLPKAMSDVVPLASEPINLGKKIKD
jgi:hypothetical protein